MDAGTQAHLAFYLTGKRTGAELEAIDRLALRPALFAGYRDLAKLRYDFPLVLARGPGDDGSVQSLSGVFDAALKDIAHGADAARLRSHALRLEREIRVAAARAAGLRLSALWDEAEGALSAAGDPLFRDSMSRLRRAVRLDGEVIDCDKAMPARLWRHAWQAVERGKARKFRAQVHTLILKLSDILEADFVRSKEGHSAESLKASVGSVHKESFDFNALSSFLDRASSKGALTESRRRRIRRLLAVLKSQKFFPASDAAEQQEGGAETYGFFFESCAEALEAYRERLPEMIELVKAIAMAGLEIDGAYDEARHDPLFKAFGTGGLDPSDVALFPDYLVSLNAGRLTPVETATLLDVLSGSAPIKTLVQSDDILEGAPIGNGSLALGARSKQLVSAAIGLGQAFVLQSSSANLFRLRERIFRGLGYRGPALFSVFSGAMETAGGLPAYLVAAAATESRAFAALVYDPSAGGDWASRFRLEDNPQSEQDWPSHSLPFEDEAHQRASEKLAFTIVDFLACDRRYAAHFARVPRAAWNAHLVPVTERLARAPSEPTEPVPCLTMIDNEGVLHKVLVDMSMIEEARRCADMWRGLQELGGINNSHAARLVAEAREAWQAEVARERDARGSEPKPPQAAPSQAAPPEAAPAPVRAPEPSEPEPERRSEEAYIDTPRCNSCNECIQINSKMFGLNKDKQAFILNLEAGTYRQLVEAAESCQVSIIHPGKPRNPSEPGLDELLKRAEPFL